MKDFFNKWATSAKKLWICSHLLEKSLMENFIICAVISISFKTTISLRTSTMMYLWLVTLNFKTASENHFSLLNLKIGYHD